MGLLLEIVVLHSRFLYRSSFFWAGICRQGNLNVMSDDNLRSRPSFWSVAFDDYHMKTYREDVLFKET